MALRAALLAAVLGLFGCGTEASDAGARAGGASTLPELELWGYLRTETSGVATDVEPGPISIDAIAESTDRSHALIHVSGFT